MSEVPFGASPSLFFFAPTDRAFRIARGWVGVLVSCIALTGLPAARAARCAAAAVWAALWVLYLSFVNVGQTFYAFGWESLLVRGRLLHDLRSGPRDAATPVLNWIYRWTLFRLMFGAGLIKLRGDAVLARPDVSRLLLRDAADAERAQLVLPPPAAIACCTAASWSITSSS